jgi:phage tail protein X
MKRKLLLLLAVIFSASMALKAQPCGIDAATRQFLIEHPELKAKYEANTKLMNEQIASFANKNIGSLAKIINPHPRRDSVGYDTFVIPVVVHVIHNYGIDPPNPPIGYQHYQDDISDAQIASLINNLNIYYNARNTDLPNVIQPFIKYIGDMRILFRLATLDPVGKPTRGVTRTASYLTNGKDNYAKLDLWDPSSYLNIWTEHYIGLGADIPGTVVAAYSQLPDVGGADPFIDGLITGAQYTSDGGNAFIISHEVGHYLGLLHPFGNNNSGCASAGCGDDGVDDTPPTTGEFCVSCAVGLYDTMCATGYVKYSPVDSIGSANDGIATDSMIYTVNRLIDYPDTANTQNIMTYSQCDPELMFTKGQVARVHGVLQATLANRNHLSNPQNLINTGALLPLPSLPPVADFSINNHFVCANNEGGQDTSVIFTNFSWNDTIKSVSWNLPTYASKPSSNSLTSFTSGFSQPGWVNISLTANGPGGSTTIIDSSSLFVADNNATPATNYVEEFNPATSTDLKNFPMFNYFKNQFKWIVNTNTGYYDQSCIQYTGYDGRTYPANSIGLALGDYDDMYTPAYDLTALGSAANLNFLYSAASLSANPGDVNDTLEIDYNTNCGALWTPLVYLSKSNLINQGASSIPYRPLYQGAWSLQSIPLVGGSKNAVSSHTIFRFRYKPGVNQGFYTRTAGGFSTGNNFYMDRLNFSNYQLGLNTLMPSDKSVIVAPNPTNGDAFVMIATKNDVNAQIRVTDIAGRVVYTTAQMTSGPITRIAIPKAAITVTGMYLVHVVAGDMSQTEKLVVY